MEKDFWSLIVLIGLCLIILYLLVVVFFKKREGLENSTDAAATTTPAAGASADGIGGNAANYAELIKAKSVQMQDSLLITKYRTDYENTIINLEDYCNLMMLYQILKINLNGDAKSTLSVFAGINALSNTKKALNEAMQYVDKQT
jgi:hypothetical protein